MGDIHQPLHTVARFPNAPAGTGDNGGILVITDHNNNLHLFWDNALHQDFDTQSELQEVVKTAALLPKPAQADIDNLDTAKWIDEGVAVAKADVYVAPIGVPKLGEPAVQYKLDEHYIANAHEVAKKRLSLAGYRLAKLITKELN